MALANISVTHESTVKITLAVPYAVEVDISENGRTLVLTAKSSSTPEKAAVGLRVLADRIEDALTQQGLKSRSRSRV